MVRSSDKIAVRFIDEAESSIAMTERSGPLRTIAVLIAAGITIWMVFNEGTLTAILFAGLFFFIGSLAEIFQRRHILERNRLITFTVTYTLAIIIILGVLAWRYRGILITSLV